MRYSIVSTVLNDCIGVEAFFAAMARQTRHSCEIVIVDGGSSDGTWEALQQEAKNPRSSVPVVTKAEPGCNVARGRDLAIEMSRGSIVVSTDVGCEWDPAWFEELVAPLEQEGDVDVVIGSWAVRLEHAKSDWARVEFARRYPFRLEATPDSLGINRAIAYKKSVWKKVGGYPQDLTLAADDVVFDMIIRQQKWGFRFTAASDVRCYWERHTTLSQFAKEERRNFYGAAEAGIWKKHFILVSGRLLVEAGSAILGFSLLFIPALRWYGVPLLALLVVALLARARTLAPCAERLKEYGVGMRWIRLFAFEYWTKIQGMTGYWHGIWAGRRKCLRTRHRIGSVR